jgi:hypothetical protein
MSTDFLASKVQAEIISVTNTAKDLSLLKSTIFWYMKQCTPLKVNRRFGGKCRKLATCFHSDFLLGLFFNPEDGGDIFFSNVGDLQRTTRRYVPEVSTPHNHQCENLKFYILHCYSNVTLTLPKKNRLAK